MSFIVCIPTFLSNERDFLVISYGNLVAYAGDPGRRMPYSQCSISFNLIIKHENISSTSSEGFINIIELGFWCPIDTSSLWIISLLLHFEFEISYTLVIEMLKFSFSVVIRL